MSEPVICDGCAVREPWEHKCHGTNIVVRGEHTTKNCECPRCNHLGTTFKLKMPEEPKPVMVKTSAFSDSSAREIEEKRHRAYMLRVVWPEINGEEPS